MRAQPCGALTHLEIIVVISPLVVRQLMQQRVTYAFILAEASQVVGTQAQLDLLQPQPMQADIQTDTAGT